MNRILLSASMLVAVQLTLFITAPRVMANVSSFDKETERTIAERVENLNTAADLKFTSEVAKKIRHYVELYPHSSEVLLGQVSLYFPTIENILREKNLPDELKYLAVIESGLRPTVKSRVGATGLWQFMKPTARMYGLEINSTVDERKDPLKSTEAALSYLNDLHEQFGDWTVAMAAYNCGPGNIRKAMRKAGSKNFWVFKKFLPRETQKYLPKFTAVAYLMNYYHKHGLTPQLPDASLRYTASAKVFDKVKFGELSKELDLDLKVIKMLNPAFVKNYIPKNDGKYSLVLPEVAMQNYLTKKDLVQDVVYANKVIHINKPKHTPNAKALDIKEEEKTIVQRLAISVADVPSGYNLFPLAVQRIGRPMKNKNNRKTKVKRKKSFAYNNSSEKVAFDMMLKKAIRH